MRSPKFEALRTAPQRYDKGRVGVKIITRKRRWVRKGYRRRARRG